MRFGFKGTAAQRAASTKTGSAGDLAIEIDTGAIAVADGVTLLGLLKRLVRVDEVTTAVQQYVTSLVVTNANLAAIAAESGYIWAVTDQNGRVAWGVAPDGTTIVNKLGFGSGSVPLAALSLTVQNALPQQLYSESGYAWAVTDSAGHAALLVAIDGTVTIPKITLPDGSITATKLTAAVQAVLPAFVPTESGWALPVTDAAGRTAGGFRLDGSFEAKVRKPLDPTRTALDTTSYVVVSDFDQARQTHRLRILRKSDGQMFRVGAATSNAIDPRLSADGTRLLFRTDAPYSPFLLDRPNNNQPQGVPTKLNGWRNVSVPIDGSNNTLTAVSSIDLFLGLGDSLTNGTGSSIGGGYLPFLEPLCGMPGYNYGIGGQTSPQIAARFNSAPATMTVSGNSIPTAGPVALTAIAPAILHNSADQASTLIGTLNGVHGTLTYTGGSADAASGYSFTADPNTLATPAACPPGASFLTDVGEQYKIAILIAWMGRNNGTNTQAVTDTQNAVAHLSPIAKRFVVMTVINGLNEPGATSAIVQTLNPALIAAFPNNFVDIRKGLVGGPDGLTSQALWPGGPVLPSAMAFNGLPLSTGTISDTTDVGMDTVPTSLRAPADVVHLNDFGYRYIAFILNQYFTWKGWV